MEMEVSKVNVFRNEKNFSGVNCREKTTFRTSVRENPEKAYFIIKIKGKKVCVKTAQKKLKNARFFVQSDKMKFFSILGLTIAKRCDKMGLRSKQKRKHTSTN